jgi:lipopolysaccharide transport system permease protein
MEFQDKVAVVVYSPESQIRTPGKLFKSMLVDLRESRELAWRLAVRDISAQYRQAFLGMLWAVILPLANTVAWLFLSSTGIISVERTVLPYPVFVFTGTMLWAIFMDALNAPLQQANAARAMLSKLNFPREALLVSGIYQTLFNASIKVVLLLVALLIVGINPGWTLLIFPVGVLSLILVGTAFGLLVTPIGMLYADVGRALPLLMQFLMYITPAVFPTPKTGWGAKLFAVNPLTPLIINSRNWLTGHSTEDLFYFLGVIGAAFFLLLLVWVVYRLAMPILIERMSV